jgi:hypothetical protein
VATNIFSVVRYGKVSIRRVVMTGKINTDSKTGHMRFKSITLLDSVAAQP